MRPSDVKKEDPVFVEDVAAAMTATLTGPAHYGRRYELCGPHSYTLQELVEFTARAARRHRIVLPLPGLTGRVQGRLFDLAAPVLRALGIEQPFSTDNYRSMQVDAVCRHNAFEALGITPAGIESIVPAYLGAGRAKPQG